MPRDEAGLFTKRPGAVPASGRPASGRPPEREGNLAAVRHGVHSVRLVEGLAESLVEVLLETHPHLVAYPFELAAWGRAEAAALMYSRYLTPALIEKGKQAARLGSDIARAERVAREARRELGLGPRSEAELARAQREAVDSGEVLKGILEHGRRVLAERAALEAGS